MRVLFLLIFFSFNSFAEVTFEQVLKRLQYHHGPEWKSLIHSDSHKKDIKKHLETIIKQPSALLKFQIKKSEGRYIREDAIAEYGNFASNSQGNLFSDSKKLLTNLFQENKKKLQSNQYNSERTALFLSWINTGTPYGIEQLLSELGQGRSVDDYNILEMINQGVKGFNPEKDISAADVEKSLTFRPNILAPYFLRPQKGWDPLVKKLRTKLSHMLRNEELPPKLKKFIRLKQIDIKKIVNQNPMPIEDREQVVTAVTQVDGELPPSSHFHKTKKPSSKEKKETKRKPASIKKDLPDKSSSKSFSLTLLLSFLVILLLYPLKMKK